MVRRCLIRLIRCWIYCHANLCLDKLFAFMMQRDAHMGNDQERKVEEVGTL